MAEPKPRRDALRRFLETHPCLLAAPEAWPEGPEPLNTRIKNEKGADRSHGPKPGHRPEQPAPLVPAGRSTLLQAGYHGQAHHHGAENLGFHWPAVARAHECGDIKERRLAGTRGHRCGAITGSNTG